VTPWLRFLDLPLIGGPVPWILGAAGIAAGTVLLAGRGRSWWARVVPATLLGSALVAALVALFVDRVWRPFPDPLPAVVVLALGGVLAAGGLTVAAFPARGRGARAGSVVALLVVVVVAAQSLNGVYREYPTLRTVLGLPAPDQLPFTDVAPRAPLVPARPGRPLVQAWTPPRDLPAAGIVTEVAVPGRQSGFAARPAMVYLPPAYLTSPRAELPVLVLMAGQPGEPRDWFDGGLLAQRLDAYAAVHAGLAPVVVVVDQLGDPLRNPLCMNSTLGQVATYLSVDVPAWIRATLQVNPDTATWAIGGLSNGGTCSLQMAVTAPQVYRTFLDISGEAEPTLGDHAATVAAAFGGDEAAFAAVNPLDVLAARSFPGTAGYLVAGAQDDEYRPQAVRVYEACRAARLDVQLHVIPGGHTFEVWGPGLSGALPWLGTRLGITG
jgi:enterochelin esterase-like enzyme